MSDPLRLFDRALRTERRERAASRWSEADYLHRAAAEGLADRLSEITRPFPNAAIVAGADGRYASALWGRFGIERLIQFEASPALADRARRAAPEVVTVVGDPFEAGGPALPSESVDLVAIGLDLHASNDPVGALIQARRALKPDGLCLACLFGGDTLSELRIALAEAEVEVSGGLSPRVAPMADLRDLGGLLQRAGFAMPVADSDRLTIWHRSALSLMAEIRAMGESNALVERRRSPMPRRLILRAAEIYAERFGREDGKIRATVELCFLTGWAPAAHQPQPLRPGSARARLADALGVEEQGAGEKAGGS